MTIKKDTKKHNIKFDFFPKESEKQVNYVFSLHVLL